MQPKPEITYWIVKYDVPGSSGLTSSALMTVGAVRDMVKWLVEAKQATNLRVHEYHMRTTVSDVTDAFAIVAELGGPPLAVPPPTPVTQPGDTVTIVGGVEVHDA